jgi:hypothetical protein
MDFMSSLLDSLSAEFLRFQTFYGHKPEQLYLGRQEAEHMKKAAAVFAGPSDPNVTTRTRWNGIPVYTVDAERYQGFGLSCPSPCS